MKCVDEMVVDLKKESDSLSKELKKLSKTISSDIINSSQVLVKKITLASKEVTRDLSVLSQQNNKVLDDITKEIRFSQFKKIYELCGKAPICDQVLLKSLLLKALLTHNKYLLAEVIQRVGLIPYTRDLEILCAFAKDQKFALSSQLIEFIQKMVATERERPLLSILMNTFQSIPELSLDRTTGTLSMKCKKALLPILIEKVNTCTANSIKSQLTDISFDALLPSFRPSIGDTSYKKTRLDLAKYLFLIGKNTDISEFLLLTLGFFRSQKIGDKEFLQSLSADYLFVQYRSCLRNIIHKVREAGVSEQIGVQQVKKIISASQQLKSFDPKHNDPRRFFETRLAQYINGLSHSEYTLDLGKPNGNEMLEPEDEELREKTLNACNKILQFFLGDSGKVNNPRDMELKISIFANGYKDTSNFSAEEIRVIADVLHHVEVYKGRDRIERDKSTKIKERKLETAPDKVGEDVWNSGGGVMGGYSPLFYDAQREPMRNLLVDSSTVAPYKKEAVQWCWNNNRIYSAYVGSISGHTCNMVGMIVKYMKNNKEDPDLGSDINLFFVQIIGVYAKRGFHAMLEIIDVLHDSYVEHIFKPYGVKLDLYAYFKNNPESAGFLKHAVNDATLYTQVLIHKKQLKEGLESHSLFRKNEVRIKFKEINEDLTKKVQTP